MPSSTAAWTSAGITRPRQIVWTEKATAMKIAPSPSAMTPPATAKPAMFRWISRSLSVSIPFTKGPQDNEDSGRPAPRRKISRTGTLKEIVHRASRRLQTEPTDVDELEALPPRWRHPNCRRIPDDDAEPFLSGHLTPGPHHLEPAIHLGVPETFSPTRGSGLLSPEPQELERLNPLWSKMERACWDPFSPWKLSSIRLAGIPAIRVG